MVPTALHGTGVTPRTGVGYRKVNPTVTTRLSGTSAPSILTMQ